MCTHKYDNLCDTLSRMNTKRTSSHPCVFGWFQIQMTITVISILPFHLILYVHLICWMVQTVSIHILFSLFIDMESCSDTIYSICLRFKYTCITQWFKIYYFHIILQCQEYILNALNSSVSAKYLEKQFA